MKIPKYRWPNLVPPHHPKIPTGATARPAWGRPPLLAGRIGGQTRCRQRVVQTDVSRRSDTSSACQRRRRWALREIRAALRPASDLGDGPLGGDPVMDPWYWETNMEGFCAPNALHSKYRASSSHISNGYYQTTPCGRALRQVRRFLRFFLVLF